RSARPSSNRTRRFLPRAPTDSIRAPASAFSSTPRRTSASAVSNRRTRAPCSALRSAVAARKTLSPSGIGLDIAAVVVLERIVRLPSRVGRTGVLCAPSTEIGAERTAHDACRRAQAQPERIDRRPLQVALVAGGKSGRDEQGSQRGGLHGLAVHARDEERPLPSRID